MIPINEIHEQFLHWLDKQSNYSAPEITPEEIDLYLNNACLDLIELVTKDGIEKNQLHLDYIKNLINTHTDTVFTTGTKPNGKIVKLPDDYKLSLLEEAVINYPDCNNVIVSKRIPVVPKTRDEYSKIIQNPFTTPWKEEIIRLVSNNNSFELVAFTGCTITNYYLDYIKEPVKMKYGTKYEPVSTDVTSELDSKGVTKIIEMAVKKALKTLGDPRIQLEQINKQIKTLD